MPDDILQASISRTVNRITQDAQRIKNILERFSQMVAPRSHFGVREIDLCEETEKFLTLMREGKKLNQIAVQNRLPRQLRATANEGIFQEILFNIFSNAYDAMKGEWTLTLEAGEKAGIVRFSVRDTGPGIPEEYRKHIFDEYFTTKTDSEAVGIGLSVTKTLMERLGGAIDSVPHENGAEFVLTFRSSRPVIKEAA